MSLPSYFVLYEYRGEVPSMYTESTVCVTPPSTASILLVALLKPVPVLNFDFVMFIFQKPICGLSAWAVMRAALALATMTPSTLAPTDDCLNADRISPGVYTSADRSHENSALFRGFSVWRTFHAPRDTSRHRGTEE